MDANVSKINVKPDEMRSSEAEIEAKSNRREQEMKARGECETSGKNKIHKSQLQIHNNGGDGTSSEVDDSRGAYLEVTEGEEPFYLLKCPNEVAKLLKHMEIEENKRKKKKGNNPSSSIVPPVAKIVFTYDPLDPNMEANAEKTLEIDGRRLGSAPCSYTLDYEAADESNSRFLVFTESTAGNVAMEGEVKNKIRMTPRYTSLEERNKHWHKRAENLKMQRKKTQIFEIEETGKQVKRYTRGPVPKTAKLHKNGVANRDAMVPVPKGVEKEPKGIGIAEKQLIAFMEDGTKWTRKELLKKTALPENLLDSLLENLCVHGSNRSTYVLKSEYQKSDRRVKGNQE